MMVWRILYQNIIWARDNRSSTSLVVIIGGVREDIVDTWKPDPLTVVCFNHMVNDFGMQ
jgi:hypothetical protein